MTRLDRYIIGQLIAAFGFFALVFTGVIWLTQAVRLIDTVIGSGQSTRVFLEFSALVLPQVLVIVLPLSGLGAALFALNKLYSDSELVVMMSAGLGPLGLLRPVTIFGALIAATMAIVLILLIPRSGALLADRSRAMRSDIASALIVERQFLHPIPGLTLFISDTSRAGEMAGIFLNDQRDPSHPVTYSAERALLVRQGREARLVMLDGVALSLGAGRQLTSVQFEQFVFDLSTLMQPERDRVPRPSEYSIFELLSPTPEMLGRGNYSVANYLSEAHYKLVLPLLAMIYPMIALVTLLAGGYRRSGFGRRVVVAVGIATLLQVITYLTRSWAQEKFGIWPLMYLPILLGAIYITALVSRLSRVRSPRALSS